MDVLQHLLNKNKIDFNKTIFIESYYFVMVDHLLYMYIHMDVQYFHELCIVIEYHVQVDDFVHHVLRSVHQYNYVNPLDRRLEIEQKNLNY